MKSALMLDQLKDSLLNSKVVPEDRAELHSLWRVLEMPFGPQQKTPTRLLKTTDRQIERERERERERGRVNRHKNTGLRLQPCTFPLYSLIIGLCNLIKQ